MEKQPTDSPVGLCFRLSEPKQPNGYGSEKTYRIDKPDICRELYEVSTIELYRSSGAVHCASIGWGLLHADSLKKMERVSADEYNAAYYSALRCIIDRHQN